MADIQFNIQRIYVKQSAFDSYEIKPSLRGVPTKLDSSIEMKIENKKLEDSENIYDVSLSLKVTTKLKKHEEKKEKTDKETSGDSAKPLKTKAEEVTQSFEPEKTSEKSSDEQELYIAKTTQAGVFRIEGLPQNQISHMLSTYCPEVLYPYVRNVLSEMMLHGGYPPITLQPINFESLYQQRQNIKKEKQTVFVDDNQQLHQV